MFWVRGIRIRRIRIRRVSNGKRAVTKTLGFHLAQVRICSSSPSSSERKARDRECFKTDGIDMKINFLSQLVGVLRPVNHYRTISELQTKSNPSLRNCTQVI